MEYSVHLHVAEASLVVLVSARWVYSIMVRVESRGRVSIGVKIGVWVRVISAAPPTSSGDQTV